jgi:hypothetical protein
MSWEAGAIRRDKMEGQIADYFTSTYDLNPKERKLALAAARLGIIEAVRGCLYAAPLSPSVREDMAAYWGLSGVTRLNPLGASH